MFNFSKLFSYDYLFNVNRVVLTRSDKVLGLLGTLLVLLAILMKVAAAQARAPVDKKYRDKFYALFLTIGILEVAWFGARYQAVRFFGTHFLALIILLVGLVWLVFIIRDIVKNYKPTKEKWEKEQVRQKYLPQ